MEQLKDELKKYAICELNKKVKNKKIYELCLCSLENRINKMECFAGIKTEREQISEIIRQYSICKTYDYPSETINLVDIYNTESDIPNEVITDTLKEFRKKADLEKKLQEIDVTLGSEKTIMESANKSSSSTYLPDSDADGGWSNLNKAYEDNQ